MLKNFIVTGCYAVIVCSECGWDDEIGGSTEEEAAASLLEAVKAEGWQVFNGRPLCPNCANI